jgi:hypothetical protein
MLAYLSLLSCVLGIVKFANVFSQKDKHMREPCSFTWGLYIFHFSKDGNKVTLRHALQPGEAVEVNITEFTEAMDRALELHKSLFSGV